MSMSNGIYAGPSSRSATSVQLQQPLARRAIRPSKDAMTAPNDIYTVPTPHLVVGGDVVVPSGPAVVMQQSLVPVATPFSGLSRDASAASATATDRPAGEAEGYMYSLDNGDMLSEISEARVLAETKVKELEKKLKQSNARAAVLESDLQSAYQDLDAKDSELQRMKLLERAANKRPDLISFLTGRASLDANAGFSMSLTSPNDRFLQLEFARRLPFLYSLPESAVLELLHHSWIVHIPAGSSIASCSEAADHLLLIMLGQAELVADGTDSSSARPAAGIMGPGECFGEHSIWKRSPAPARDPSKWVVKRVHGSSWLVAVAIPALLIRRFLLSENQLLDIWTESSVAAMTSHTYSPLRPPARTQIHSDVPRERLVSHATKHKSLLHVATGGHILEALAVERRAAARKAAQDARTASDLADDDDDDEVDGEGAAAKAVASIPPHILQTAPMLLHLSQSECGPGVSYTTTLQRMVQAAERFFGCAAAAFFEVDDSPRVQQSMHQPRPSATSARHPVPFLVPRIVPWHAATVTDRLLPLSGTAGLCATTSAIVNVKDTAAESRFNAQVEPIAGPMSARTILCVPVYAQVPDDDTRHLCGVIQLIDKRTNTSAYFPASQLREDEMQTFVASGDDDAGANTGASQFPGAVGIGADNLPRYPFTSRDEELAQLVATRMGDTIAAALRQAVSATSHMGASSTDADAAGAARTPLGFNGRDDSLDVPGLSQALRGSVDVEAQSPSPNPALNMTGSSTMLMPSRRILAIHTVTDTLQWRPRSLYASVPLEMLASPLALAADDGDGAYSDEGPRYPPPSTALLNGTADGEEPIDAELSAVPPSERPAAASVYLYVRACVVSGRCPITPDAQSAAARAMDGATSGRLANGNTSGSIDHVAGNSGSLEGCSANWSFANGPAATPAASSSADERSSFQAGDESRGWLDVEARVCDLPRDSTIVFAVHEEDPDGGSGRPLFWASAPLFTSAQTLTTGRQLLQLHLGSWPGSVAGAVADAGGSAGLLEVDIGSVGIPAASIAVDCDLARGPHWFRGLAAAANLQLDVGDGAGAEAAAGSLMSPMQPGKHVSAFANDAIEDLVLDPQSTSAVLLNGRIVPAPVMPSPLLSQVVGSSTTGIDARNSAPLLAPALQSGKPMYLGSFAPPLPRGAASSASVRSVSPGVERLTADELAIVRGLKAGNATADCWYPHLLSPALRFVLWTYRRQLLSSGGLAVLPLLLKAAPFLHHMPPTHAVQSLATASEHPVLSHRSALSLLMAITDLPVPVALQLADAAFGDATIRAAASHALVSSLWHPRTTGVMNSPSVTTAAIACLMDAPLDSALTRSLMRAAVEAPLTVGRQLLWAWRSTLGATGMRSRCIRLIRALLDVSDEYTTSEAALQSHALTQIATACSRSLVAQSKSANTLLLQSSIAGVSSTLPFAFRLPLQPHERIIPSVYFRSLADGSLHSALQGLLNQATSRTRSNPAIGSTEQPVVVSANRDGTAAGSDVRGRPRTSMLSGAAAPAPRAPSPHPNDDSDEDDDDRSSDGGSVNHRAGGDAADRNDDDDESSSTTSPDAVSIIQEIEDGMALAMVSLGAYSDAPAFGLALEAASNPAECLQALVAAAQKANAAYAASAARSATSLETDPRLPIGGPSIRATASNPIVDATGKVLPCLPYPAAVLQAVTLANAASLQTGGAAGAAADSSTGDMDAAERILALYRASTTGAAAAAQGAALQASNPDRLVVPVPSGVSIPAAGLCVSGLVVESSRVQYTNHRRKYSRSVLAFNIVPDTDESRPGAAANAISQPVATGAFASVVKLRTHVPRPLRFRNNVVHVLGITGDDCWLMNEAVHAKVINTMSQHWREAGLPVGDFSAPYVYGLHWVNARDPSTFSATTAAAAASTSSSFARGPGSASWGAGSPFDSAAGEGVGGRLFGMLVTAPEGRTISEILDVSDEDEVSPVPTAAERYPSQSRNDGFAVSARGAVRGYGSNGIQRWFMSNLYNRFAGADVQQGSSYAAPEAEQDAEQYSTIVNTYLLSLAAVIVSSYVLALGQLKPADLLLTPSGHVALAGIGYRDGVPDSSLESDHSQPDATAPDAAPRPKARFASQLVVGDLLAVLGVQALPAASSMAASVRAASTAALPSPHRPQLSALGAELIMHCADAFMCVRRHAMDIIAQFGAFMVGTPCFLCSRESVGRRRPVSTSCPPRVSPPLFPSTDPSLLPASIPPYHLQHLSLPGMSSPHDIQRLRSRLLIECPDAEAHLRFTTQLMAFLHLD